MRASSARLNVRQRGRPRLSRYRTSHTDAPRSVTRLRTEAISRPSPSCADLLVEPGRNLGWVEADEPPDPHERDAPLVDKPANVAFGGREPGGELGHVEQLGQGERGWGVPRKCEGLLRPGHGGRG